MIRDKKIGRESAEYRALKETKRVCSLVARMVRDFWQNVDKVVELRAQVNMISIKKSLFRIKKRYVITEVYC